MALRDKLLPTINRLRALPEMFGLRRYSVTLRRRKWASGVVGRGPASFEDIVLTPPPKVRLLTTEQVASSSGTYQQGDMSIDKITPRYELDSTGGYRPVDLHLEPKQGEDVCVILTGDDGTHEYEMVQLKVDRSFTYSMVVRKVRVPDRY